LYSSKIDVGTPSEAPAQANSQFVAYLNVCAEHRHQVVLRRLFRADAPPSLERLIRDGQSVRDVRARPDPPDVIVGLVSVFLQLGEDADNLLQLRFDCCWVLLVLKLQDGPAHFSMLEHPPEPRTLICKAPV
jgi:hypothetical protein